MKRHYWVAGAAMLALVAFSFGSWAKAEGQAGSKRWISEAQDLSVRTIKLHPGGRQD